MIYTLPLITFYLILKKVSLFYNAIQNYFYIIKTQNHVYKHHFKICYIYKVSYI